MARRAILAAIVWVCLAGAGVAQTLTFPALTGRVVDDAGLLTAAERGTLTNALADLEAKTTDQLVVVTLKSLQGTSIEDYGYQLGRRWQIGQKGKDNGVLLIVAAAEKKVRIEVGYGLEGVLTDAATKGMIENAILPRFKAGDFAGGIKNGAGDIIQALAGDTGAPRPGTAGNTAPAHPRSDGSGPVWPGILLGLAGVGLLIFCAVSRGAACQAIFQVALMIMLSGRGGGSRRQSSFSGGGGSFGGGGSSGSW